MEPECQDGQQEYAPLCYRLFLLKELQAYSPELLDKRRVVSITKCDLQDPAELHTKEIRRALPPGLPTVFISSVTGSGVNALKEELWKALNESGHQQEHQ